jgi:hypothetical protein
MPEGEKSLPRARLTVGTARCGGNAPLVRADAPALSPQRAGAPRSAPRRNAVFDGPAPRNVQFVRNI